MKNSQRENEPTITDIWLNTLLNTGNKKKIANYINRLECELKKVEEVRQEERQRLIELSKGIVSKVCVRVYEAKYLTDKFDICLCIEREIKEELRK